MQIEGNVSRVSVRFHWWTEIFEKGATESDSPESRLAYRVVSVRANDSGFRSAYAVEVQAAVGFDFPDETFTVRVDAPEGFDQAVRRAVRKSVERVSEWNAENPDVISLRWTRDFGQGVKCGGLLR